MPIFLWSVVVSQSITWARNDGSGAVRSAGRSMTATFPLPPRLLHPEGAVHAGVDVAVEIVRSRVERRDIVRHLRWAGDNRSSEEIVRGGLVREDRHVVGDAGVLVVEVDLERLPGGSLQARRVEVDALRREAQHAVLGGPALVLLLLLSRHRLLRPRRELVLGLDQHVE